MSWLTEIQGGLDGLCGQYAIANAFKLCGVKNTMLTWQRACSALPPDFWPDGLWKGTDFNHLCLMLDKAARMREARRLSIGYRTPFKSQLTHEQFQDKLQKELREPDVTCAIIKLNAPSHHWLVVEREGGRLFATDSSLKNSSDGQRRNLGAIRSGRQTAGHEGKWIMDRYDIALICSGY